VTSITECRGLPATVTVEVAPAPALRPAGKPRRDPGSGATAATSVKSRRCRRLPIEPTGRRQRNETQPAPVPAGRAARRGGTHGDHQQASQEDRARPHPAAGLADALVHAV